MAKILSHMEFITLPANTVYQDYEGGTNRGKLKIKGDSIPTADFWVQDIDATDTDDIGEMIEMFRSGVVTFDLDCESRDAEFNEEARYLVYDDTDVRQLIDRLTECVVKG